MTTIGVIGIGNPLRRDDGIGIFLVESIKNMRIFKDKPISFLDGGTRGIGLIHLFDQFDKILLVDAVEMKKKPGSFHFFSIDEVQSNKKKDLLSSHSEDVLSIVLLAKEIHSDIKPIYVFGIQPENVSFGQEFSIEIRKNLVLLQEELKKTIQRLIEK